MQERHGRVGHTPLAAANEQKVGAVGADEAPLGAQIHRLLFELEPGEVGGRAQVDPLGRGDGRHDGQFGAGHLLQHALQFRRGGPSGIRHDNRQPRRPVLHKGNRLGGGGKGARRQHAGKLAVHVTPSGLPMGTPGDSAA